MANRTETVLGRVAAGRAIMPPYVRSVVRICERTQICFLLECEDCRAGSRGQGASDAVVHMLIFCIPPWHRKKIQNDK